MKLGGGQQVMAGNGYEQALAADAPSNNEYRGTTGTECKRKRNRMGKLKCFTL
jgi:hypothetical protein